MRNLNCCGSKKLPTDRGELGRKRPFFVISQDSNPRPHLPLGYESLRISAEQILATRPASAQANSHPTNFHPAQRSSSSIRLSFSIYDPFGVKPLQTTTTPGATDITILFLLGILGSFPLLPPSPAPKSQHPSPISALPTCYFSRIPLLFPHFATSPASRYSSRSKPARTL
jgi:hypothetical protein